MREDVPPTYPAPSIDLVQAADCRSMFEIDGRCVEFFKLKFYVGFHTDDSASQHDPSVPVVSEHVSTHLPSISGV